MALLFVYLMAAKKNGHFVKTFSMEYHLHI